MLVVDDEPDIAALIAEQLRPYEVETDDRRTSGAEALERLRDEHFDAMTLDILMPGMSGFEVLRAVRADPELRDPGRRRVGLQRPRGAGGRMGRSPSRSTPSELADALGSAVLAGRVRVLVVGARVAARRARAGARASSASSTSGPTSAAAAARLCQEHRFEVALVDAGMRSPRRRARGARPARAAAAAARSSSSRRRRARRARRALDAEPGADRGRRDRGAAGAEPRASEGSSLRAPGGRARARSTTREELARCAALATREAQAADKERQLERYAADLRETFKQERARAQELRESYVATVRALANAVEARDAYTGKHAERVAAYGLEIARARRACARPTTRRSSSASCSTTSARSRCPTRSSTSPSRSTPQERALMSSHPVIGWEILREIDFLGEAKLVVRHHHERWDGDGYPDGLEGDEIPLAARVFAVADTLDALTTDRPYRPASPIAEARAHDPARPRHAVRPGASSRRSRRMPDDVLRAHPRRRSAECATVLIVDDDPFIRKLIATTLEDVAGLRARRGRATASRRWRSPRASRPRSSSSTSTCRAWTASTRARSCGGAGDRRARRS